MQFVSASDSVKIHKFPTGQIVHSYQPNTKTTGPIRSVSSNNTGSWLAVVPHAGHVEIVGAKNQSKLLQTIQVVEHPACAVFQNTTRKHVVLGTKDGKVLIYDIKARSIKKRFPTVSSTISHLGVTLKDAHVAVGCSTGEVLMFSNLTNELSVTLRVPRSKSVSTLCCNPLKRHLILGGSNEGVLAVWDYIAGKQKFMMQGHKAPVTAAVFSPINSDLLVSTGLDRTFSFFDVEDHKCIATIAVPHSLMSVCFSESGNYILMGSQDGHVFVYDSRKIQEAVNTFQAHDSSIKHLIFQSPQEYSTETCNLTEDSIKVTEDEDVKVKSRTSELFALFAANQVDTSGPESVTCQSNDSFMAALGWEKNQSAGSREASFKATSSFKVDSIDHSTRPQLEEPKVIAPSPLAKKQKETEGPTQKMSTPKLVNAQFIKAMSPFCNVSPVVSDLNAVTDFKRITKEIIDESVKEAFGEVRSEMKAQTSSLMGELRHMMIDMQMSIVKEFIKLENHQNCIREELGTELTNNSDRFLQEEIVELRKRVAFLEEQLEKCQNGNF